jgi:fused signal recognition particle receptor
VIWFFNKKKKEELPEEVEAPQTEAPTVESSVEAVAPEAAREAEEVSAHNAPPENLPEESNVQAESQQGWFTRLKSGLSLSSNKLTEGITGIFTKRKLDQAALDELEELLITADLGPATAAKLAAAVGKNRFDKEIGADEIRAALAEEIEKILAPVEKPLFASDEKPFVILMVGVNGTGKTTTIGKLGQQFRREGKQVMLAAGDTFRAAAVAQLKVWGDRIGCAVVTKDEGADAAALAYEALDRAEAEGADVLMIDTAGRLQNKTNLMEELSKIVRVIRKKNAAAPHAILLVLDATVGQNAHSQLELFKEMVDITGLIVTKLDGTAKGGVLVSLAERFQLPVHAIGIGEGIDDLRPFAAADYARAIVGLDAASSPDESV